MSSFIVHSIPGSPYGRAVLATLTEKHQAFGFLAPRSIKSDTPASTVSGPRGVEYCL